MPLFSLPPRTITLANGNNAAPQLTLTLEFSVTAACFLSSIDFFTPTGASGLPDSVCLFDASTQAQVSGTVNLSPGWAGGAAGSNAWVSSANSGVALAPGKSYFSAVHVGTSAPNGYGRTAGFWNGSGAGAAGFTAGPGTAPNLATAPLQGAVSSGPSSLTFPTVAESGTYFGVGVTLRTASGQKSGLILLPYA